MRVVINIGRPFSCKEDIDHFHSFFSAYIKQTISDKLEGFNLEFVTINENGVLCKVSAEDDLYTPLLSTYPEIERIISEYNYYTLIDTLVEEISGRVDLLLSILIGKDENFIILMNTSLIDSCAYFLELDVIKDE